MQRETTLADVVAARRVVDRYLPRAPLERSPLLSDELGADVHLKIETFKPTRTFKVRGALNKIASLDAAARARGVVAASAGSHAQGVAYAAWAIGARATVVMPRGVPETIVRVCEAYGADVRLEGAMYDDTLALAHRIERDEGKTFVHPYADPLIVAGQGTIGLELLEDLPNVEPVCVPMRKGSILLLTNRTPHATFENTTDRVRWSMDLRYQSAADLRSDLARLKRDLDSGRSGSAATSGSVPSASTSQTAVSSGSIPAAVAD